MKAVRNHLIGLFFILVACAPILFPEKAWAVFELSGGFSYNRSNYSDSNFSWSRRWGASLGYYFTDRSEIEFAIQDVVDRTKITGFEDTTFHDQIYSVDWVQYFLGKNAPVQPYGKLGIGQLNREANGVYANGASPPAILDSVTGIIGAGARIYLTRTFAIRTEVTSYLTGGSISTYKDNVAFNVGISIYF